MRISHQHRFVFFSNPKTGSESMRALLDPISDFHGSLTTAPGQPFHDHMRPIDAREAFRQLGLDYTAYYKFVFVRNPWTRLVSLYAMILSRDPTMRLPFLAWLETTMPHGPGGGAEQSWRKYGTYSLGAFAGDGSGTLFVDEVFRMEDIDKVPEALRRRGVPLERGAQVPKVNLTAGKIDYTAVYPNRRAIDFVGDRYAEEIKRFRYRFPR